MDYRVEKGLVGRPRVTYSCPRCQSPLESPLEEAGTKQPCPTCGVGIIVPGIKEKLVADQERRGAEARRKAAEDAERQRQAIQARAATEERERRRREKLQRRAKGIPPAWVKASDSFLAWAFAFGKLISVLVVAACFLTILLAALGLATTWEREPQNNPIPIVAAPTITRYLEYHSARQNAAKESRPADSAGIQQSSPQPTNSPLSRLKAALAAPYLSYVSMQPIYQALDECRSDEREAFVGSVEKFVSDLNSMHRTDQDKVEAMQWFASEISFQLLDRRIARESAASARQLESLRVSSRRYVLLGTLGTAFVSLLAFLFLPLLIQIEQNTRRLVDHTQREAAPADSSG